MLSQYATFAKFGNIRSQRGIAVIEFALIMAVMVFLWIGTVEVGYALHRYTTLSKAVRDAARYLSDKALVGSVGIVDSDCTTPVNSTNCPAAVTAQTLVNQFFYAGSTSDILPDWASNTTVTITAPTNLGVGPKNPHIAIQAVYNHDLLSGTLMDDIFELVSGNQDNNKSSGFVFTSTVLMRAQ